MLVSLLYGDPILRISVTLFNLSDSGKVTLLSVD